MPRLCCLGSCARPARPRSDGEAARRWGDGWEPERPSPARAPLPQPGWAARGHLRPTRAAGKRSLRDEKECRAAGKANKIDEFEVMDTTQRPAGCHTTKATVNTKWCVCRGAIAAREPPVAARPPRMPTDCPGRAPARDRPRTRALLHMRSTLAATCGFCMAAATAWSPRRRCPHAAIIPVTTSTLPAPPPPLAAARYWNKKTDTNDRDDYDYLVCATDTVITTGCRARVYNRPGECPRPRPHARCCCCTWWHSGGVCRRATDPDFLDKYPPCLPTAMCVPRPIRSHCLLFFVGVVVGKGGLLTVPCIVATHPRRTTRCGAHARRQVQRRPGLQGVGPEQRHREVLRRRRRVLREPRLRVEPAQQQRRLWVQRRGEMAGPRDPLQGWSVCTTPRCSLAGNASPCPRAALCRRAELPGPCTMPLPPHSQTCPPHAPARPHARALRTCARSRFHPREQWVRHRGRDGHQGRRQDGYLQRRR